MNGLTYEMVMQARSAVRAQMMKRAPAWAKHLESRGISVSIDAWQWKVDHGR